MNSSSKLLLISAVSTVLLQACGENSSAVVERAGPLTLAPAGAVDAAAKFISRDGVEIGHAVLSNTPSGGTIIRVSINGLSEGWHGLHLHQIGDCTDGDEGFLASGGHVDPEAREHGLLNPAGPERADLPNLYSNGASAVAEFYTADLALYPSEAAASANGPYPLMDEDGFAIVIHESADDHRSQPIGGAGARLACAAIGGE